MVVIQKGPLMVSYEIIEDTEDYILIKDLGPWDQYMTITNAAEEVVAELAPTLAGRRLEYIDSEGRRDQLLVRNGRFVGFATCELLMRKLGNNSDIDTPHTTD